MGPRSRPCTLFHGKAKFTKKNNLSDLRLNDFGLWFLLLYTSPADHGD